MSNNYIENKKVVLEDYYICIGAFENCKTLFNEISQYSNEYEKDSEMSKIINARKNALISNLGQVGEKALKYIIGLELIRTNPNMDAKSLDEFFRKQNPLKNFATRHGIDIQDERLNKLLNYSDLNNQKSHNFDYWYSILELTMPNIIEKLKNLMYNSIQSLSIEQYCDQNNISLVRNLNPYLNYYSTIPNRISSTLDDIIDPSCLKALDDKDLKRMGAKNHFFTNLVLDLKRKNIRKCGDVFTRLRYSSNNPDKKKFNVKELFEIINYFVLFITFIHNNDDNLDINIDTQFAKQQCIKFKDILQSTEMDIEKVFESYIINDGLALQRVLNSKFSFKEIAKMINLGVTKNDFFYVIEDSNLNSRVIEYYKSIGITDYDKMEKLLNEYLKTSIEETSSKKKK